MILGDMSVDVCVKVGRRISHLRANAGMSQAILADRASIDRSTLSHIENGRADLKLRTLRDIAKALGVTLSDLLQGID